MRGWLRKVLKRIFGDKVVAYLGQALDRLNDMRIMLLLRCRWFLQGDKWMSPQTDVSVSPDTNIPETAKADRTKPQVLFVAGKWCDCKPRYGLTNNEHNLFGSLEASGLATQKRFHFDEYYYRYKHAGDAALVKLCLESRPDLLVLSWGPGSPYDPKLETLDVIRNKMRIPIAAVWCDIVCPNEMAQAEELLPFVDLNVVFGSTTVHLTKSQHPEKYLPTWVPQDPRIFYNPGWPRDIGISFLGGISNYPDRSAGLAALRAGGIKVHQAGGQREKRLSVSSYARIHMRSKIGLNFCLNAGYVQCKGRVFEILLCGAMLLEADNPETSVWLEPMVDFVPFSNEADLVQKARYYLEHDAEREGIAARGYGKAKERYTGGRFWKTILSKLLDTRRWSTFSL